MKNIVGVRFRKAGKIYHFWAQDLPINKGDAVIVETARGVEFGIAVTDVVAREEESLPPDLKQVIRAATPDDRLNYEENRLKEIRAFDIAKEKIAAHGLDMKLLNVEYTFEGNKILFYFTAEDRVDFRELARDLASVFRARIELRQVGVRDEAKILGGLGSCGREICCNSWMADFTPVSIKMAKDQNLSLNPTKISGLCGRLMCCLNYEEEHYAHMRQLMPKVGSTLKYKGEEATVVECNHLIGRLRLRINKDQEDSFEFEWIDHTELLPKPEPEKKPKSKKSSRRSRPRQRRRRKPTA